jgi:uncharacterized caspase-like protein
LLTFDIQKRRRAAAMRKAVLSVAAVVWTIAVALMPGSATAEKRVALVIGNSAYRSVAQLRNPESDATSMAALFRAAGFDLVMQANNVGGLDFKRAIRKFEDSTSDADIAVVYFAGHGIEIAGTNYVIPVDARLASDRDAEDEAIPLTRLIESVESARRLRLVILDACRDNPFIPAMKRTRRTATRGIASGLGKVEPATANTLIAYAAKAGSTAEDGDGFHSPFTTGLLDNLTLPGLDVRLAFGRVRDEVIKITGGRQEPFVYGSLGGSIVALVPAPAKEDNRAAAPKPEISPVEQANLEITFWNSIKDSTNTRLFKAYLHRYPAGAFAEIAKIKLDDLEKNAQTAPAEAHADNVAINDLASLKEVRERLYALNFDPGPFEGPYTDQTGLAIREFERQSNLTPTGVATQGLLQRLRRVDALKPWGALVFGQANQKWGMSWGEATRKAAVSSARASCGTDKVCPVEVSFFGTECGAFAHSKSGWAIVARADIAGAKAAALTECRKAGKGCEIIASVCADGAERFTLK